MGFAKEIKSEILSKEMEVDRSGLPFLSGLIGAQGVYCTQPKIKLEITTDIEELPSFVDNILLKLYGRTCDKIKVSPIQIKKTEYVKMYFDEEFAYQILIDTGCASLSNGSLKKEESVNEYMIKEEEDLKAYIEGAFVGCGTSNIKINKDKRASTGYHLEFASKNHEFLSGIGHILAQFDIFAKLVQRKNMFTLYVKDANEVSNVLALIGAYNCVFDLQNEMAIREVRNKVNRQTNCMNANITKTVDASIKQNDAIQKIVMEMGLENLPEDLQNVALLRMANSDESLDELVALAKFPITKSGLSYRLNKLIKIANKIKE